MMLAAGPVQAATFDFDGAFTQVGGGYVEDGLQTDDVRIVTDGCGVAAPCASLLGTASWSLTSQTIDSSFSLSSFWFSMQGKAKSNILFVLTDLLASPYMFTFANYGNAPAGHLIDLTVLSGFNNMRWVTFSTVGDGNVRIDDLQLQAALPAPSAVPVPAAGGLLALGLGALTLLRRRKTA